MDGDGTAAATAAKTPAGLSQPASAGPRGDGRHLLCAAHRLSMECAEPDNSLLVVLGASAVSGVDGGGGVRDVLVCGPAGLRRTGWHRLELAGARWSDEQGAAGGGKKPVATRPIAASAGSSAHCWWTAAASRSPSSLPGPTPTITS